VVAAQPHRVLTLDAPGFYSGVPDQLAAAGIADLRMFSSLDLLATAEVTELAARDPSGALRRALGVDIVVTFGTACPGRLVAEAPSERASICRDDRALQPPYWLPAGAVSAGGEGSSAIRPREAQLDVARAVAESVPAVPVERGATRLTVEVDAPTDGWLWIDRAWWPAWRTTVDGREVESVRGLAGQLVPIAAGRHTVRQELVPWDAWAGALIGLVSLVGAVGWVRPWSRSPGGRSRAAPARPAVG
jgi:hypothetical protein